MIPSIMHMRMIHETSLSCGKPPRRPPDLDLVRDVSHLDAPFIDPGRMGTLEDQDTALRVLGRLKEEGDLLPTSSTPTPISDSVLWEEKNGRNGLPTYTFGMGDVKEEFIHMKIFQLMGHQRCHCWGV